MFFGILQPYIIDIYRFYFEEHMPGYLGDKNPKIEANFEVTI